MDVQSSHLGPSSSKPLTLCIDLYVNPNLLEEEASLLVAERQLTYKYRRMLLGVLLLIYFFSKITAIDIA